MRIAVFENIANANAGGAEKSMSQFCRYLVSNSVEVFLVCDELQNYSIADVDRVLEINTKPLRTQGFKSYVKSLISLVKFVKSNEIELILTHTIHAFPLIRLATVFSNAYSAVYFKWIYNGSKLGFMNTWGLNGIHKLVFINEFVQDSWMKFVTQKNIKETFLVADGIDFPSIDSSYGKGGYSDNAFRILYFGRIYEGKGLHILIEALAQLNLEAELHIYGRFLDDNYRQRILRIVTDLDLQKKVFFKGFSQNLETEIVSSDLVVVPSILPDAQPLAVLETIALKKPVIASDIDGINLIFKNDKEFLFTPNATSLAQKIIEIKNLSDDELNYRCSNLYSSVKLGYHKPITISKLLNVLRS